MTPDEVALGRFVLSISEKRLWCDGELVPLKPKEAYLLALLAERRPDVVSRNEILDRLWSESGSDAALSQTIHRLRQTLHRYDPTPYIETIPERGFRLTSGARIESGWQNPDSLRPDFSTFQRAAALFKQLTESSLAEAIRLLEGLWKEQPANVPVGLMLAKAYMNSGIKLFRAPHDAFWRTRVAIERVLELEPANADAFAVLSVLALYFNGDRATARDAAERALLIDPASPVARNAAFWECAARRDFVGALLQADRAIHLDPASAHFASLLGIALYLSGRFIEARTSLATALSIDSTYTAATFYDACCCALMGDYASAKTLLAGITSNDFGTRIVAYRGYLAAKTGDERTARSVLAELSAAKVPSNISHSMVQMALQDYEGAAASIQLAMRLREPGFFLVGIDPTYGELRDKVPTLARTVESPQPRRCDRCGKTFAHLHKQHFYQSDLCLDCRSEVKKASA